MRVAARILLAALASAALACGEARPSGTAARGVGPEAGVEAKAVPRTEAAAGAEAVPSPRRSRRTVRKAPPADPTIGPTLASRPRGPYFDRPELLEGFVTVALRGVDPGAPRRLALWRMSPAPHRIATAASSAGGRFDFGQWPIPGEPVEYRVGPEGTGVPSEGDRSGVVISR